MNRRKHKRMVMRLYRKNLKSHDTFTSGYVDMMKNWMKSDHRIIMHEQNVYYRRIEWRK